MVDTMPLTSAAKLVIGAQALAALVTIGLVVARARQHPGLKHGR